MYSTHLPLMAAFEKSRRMWFVTLSCGPWFPVSTLAPVRDARVDGVKSVLLGLESYGRYQDRSYILISLFTYFSRDPTIRVFIGPCDGTHRVLSSLWWTRVFKRMLQTPGER